MPSDGESRELRCLTAITEARLYFCEKIVEHASQHFDPASTKRQPDDVTSVLRGEQVYRVAQFFYLMEELDLRNPVKFRMLIERQNADMTELQNNTSRIRLMGLNVQRVKEGVFSEDQQNKIFVDTGFDENGKVRLDQSDISKFMVVSMSPESCRQAVVALADGGLLHRRGHGKVMVSSPGIMERYFREHLAIIDRCVNTSDKNSTFDLTQHNSRAP